MEGMSFAEVCTHTDQNAIRRKATKGQCSIKCNKGNRGAINRFIHGNGMLIDVFNKCIELCVHEDRWQLAP